VVQIITAARRDDPACTDLLMNFDLSLT